MTLFSSLDTETSPVKTKVNTMQIGADTGSIYVTLKDYKTTIGVAS